MNMHPEISFSILIPAKNEQDSVGKTVEEIAAVFAGENITDYEILVINDNSTDCTGKILERLKCEFYAVRTLNNSFPGGFGSAVRKGLSLSRGNAVALVMADGSERAEDVLAYYKTMKRGAECVFGSRFIDKAEITGYPKAKLLLNRLGNRLISAMFDIGHNDITNAFKAYRRDVIDTLAPLKSRGFALSIELPLKAIASGHSFVTVPVAWSGRTSGRSKFKVVKVSLSYAITALAIRLRRNH